MEYSIDMRNMIYWRNRTTRNEEDLFLIDIEILRVYISFESNVFVGLLKLNRF